MKDPTDRATIGQNPYIFYFNEYLKHKGFEIQNYILTKEQIRANWLIWTSAGFSILGSGIIIYKFISPSKRIRVAELAASIASHALNRFNMLVNSRNYG